MVDAVTPILRLFSLLSFPSSNFWLADYFAAADELIPHCFAAAVAVFDRINSVDRAHICTSAWICWILQVAADDVPVGTHKHKHPQLPVAQLLSRCVGSSCCICSFQSQTLTLSISHFPSDTWVSFLFSSPVAPTVHSVAAASMWHCWTCVIFLLRNISNVHNTHHLKLANTDTAPSAARRWWWLNDMLVCS